MKPTDAQFAAIEKMQSGNPSMLPITWGYFSDGCISLTIIWSFAPTEFFKQSLNPDGTFSGHGGGPYPVELLKQPNT